MDRYKGLLHYTQTTSVWFWRRILDELTQFTWRPFLGCEWWRDDWQLHWAGVEMWIFGRLVYIMEYYAPFRVARRLGQVQDIVGDIPVYP